MALTNTPKRRVKWVKSLLFRKENYNHALLLRELKENFKNYVKIYKKISVFSEFAETSFN
jgi:hypothetical protein